MAQEGFLRRWARLKSSGGEPAPEAARAPVPVPAAVAETAAPPAESEKPAAPLPTLEDVARLTPDADFSAFVARGVDKSVQRLALKKLFADPHFNAIDGLDMYMNDYNKASPLPPDMLASLKHAPGVLSRLLEDQQEERQGQEQGEAPATLAQAPAQERAPASPSTQQGNA